jgi:high-affinity nickel-transport protein
VRRVFYNIAVTTLSVALAMILGTVVLLQMAARALGLSNGFWGLVQSLDSGHLG